MDLFRLVSEATLGLAILVLILWLAWRFQRLGSDLVLTRMSLMRAQTTRSAAFLALAMAFLLASTGVEVYSEFTGRPWIVASEALRTVSLAWLLVALAWFVPVVLIPRAFQRSRKP